MSQMSMLKFLYPTTSSDSVSVSTVTPNPSEATDTENENSGSDIDTDTSDTLELVNTMTTIDPANLLPLNKEERHLIISKGPCQPRNLKFPAAKVGGQRRSFQHKWYDLSFCKQWIEYSVKKDSMFCFACRLFGAVGGVGEICEQAWKEDGVQGASWKNALRQI